MASQSWTSYKAKNWLIHLQLKKTCYAHVNILWRYFWICSGLCMWKDTKIMVIQCAIMLGMAQYWGRFISQELHQPHSSGKYTILFTIWTLVLMIGNAKVVKHHNWVIQLALDGPVARHYWNSKITSASTTLTELDLPALECTYNKSTPV